MRRKRSCGNERWPRHRLARDGLPCPRFCVQAAFSRVVGSLQSHAQMQTLWNPMSSKSCEAGAVTMLPLQYNLAYLYPCRCSSHDPSQLADPPAFGPHFGANRDASRHSGFPSTRSAAHHSPSWMYFIAQVRSHMLARCLPTVETVEALSHPCFSLPHQ